MLGAAYVEKGAPDLAIPVLDKAIELSPQYASAYNNRGLAYQAKGELDLAQRDFNKAAEIDPRYVKTKH